MRHVLRALIAFSVSLLLIACGGGGGLEGGGDNGSGGGGGGTPTTVIAFDLFSSIDLDANGRPVVNANGTISGTTASTVSATTPLSLVARVTNSSGTPQADQLATFEATLGAIVPISSTALTDANGVAVIELRAGTVPGAGTATVTVASTSATHGFETLGDEGNSADILLTVSIVDQAGDQINSTNPITASNPGEIRITATNSAGVALVNRLVTVTNNSGVGVLSPLSGTVLTDGNGLAVIGLLAGNTQGAGEVTIALDIVSGTATFQVGAANLELGYCESDNPADGVPDDCNGSNFVSDTLGLSVAKGAQLSAGGTAAITAVIVDGSNLPFGTPVDVQFTSTCASATPPLAFIDNVKTTIDGVAEATYRADGCTADTVTATVDTSGIALVSTVSLDIAQADAASIEFLEATPETIVLRGTGGSGRSETSVVRFRVRDTSGNPSPNRQVDFSLTTEVGGLQLSTTTASTDADGIAQVTVQSGAVSTVVRVKATLPSNISINTLSDQLVVSTGLPDQNSFSLSAETLNVEAWSIDGVQVPVTIRVADHFNNPVPDGTAVNFTTEGGAIESQCTTVDGACSVNWTSQASRPVGLSLFEHNLLFCDEDGDPTNGSMASPDPGEPCLAPPRSAQLSGVNGRRALFKGGMGAPYGGRVTILATAVGEESFNDANGNGLYDEDESFTDLTEAFRDDNEDGVFGGKELDDVTPSPGAADGDAARHACYAPFANFVCYDSGQGDLDLDGISGGQWQQLLTQDPFDADMLMRLAGGNDEEFVDFLQDNNGGTTEFFDFDRDSDGDADGGDGIYNGTLCSDAAEAAGKCSKTTINVRASLTLLMADSASAIRFTDSGNVTLQQVDLVAEPSKRVVIWFADFHNGLPPAGTEISVTTSNGVLNGATSFVVPNSNQIGPGSFSVFLGRETTPNGLSSGIMTVTFTTPGGLITGRSLTVLDGG